MRGDAGNGKEGTHLNTAKEESAKVTLETGEGVGKLRERRGERGGREKNKNDLGSQRFMKDEEKNKVTRIKLEWKCPGGCLKSDSISAVRARIEM